MIILKLIMNPFGCFGNKTIEFNSGLNVVLGPNEAGKSTMFYAIQSVLFTPSRLQKREKKAIERFIPISGNTSFVEINFQIKGKTYFLRKKWGGSILEELVLPDGAVITGENGISRYIDALLPAKQGAFKSILMTYQTGLSKTIDELKNTYPDTIHTLGDVLRKAFLETDGVSIDRFKENLEKQYNDYFNHWDISRNCPEKDRGIENPWQREVGKVLETFYKKERIKTRYYEVKSFEEEYDRLNRDIEKLRKIIIEKEKYLQKYKKPLEDIEKRKGFMLQIEINEREKKDILKVIDDWPVREREIEELRRRVKELEEKKQTLEKEKEMAEKEKANKEIRERYCRARKIKEELDEILNKLSSRRWITKDKYENIKGMFRKYERLKNELSSAGVDININAKKDLNFLVKSGVSNLQSMVLKTGELFSIKAEGIAEIIHEDWEMKVSSSVKDVSDLMKKLKELEKSLKTVKMEYGVNTLEEVEQIYIEYEKLAGLFDKQKKVFESELGGYSFDLLEAEIKKTGQEKVIRSVEEIIAEHESVKHEINRCNDEIKRNSEILSTYKENYKTKDELLSRFTELINREKELNEELKKLEPVPEDIKDIESFVREYENCKNEFEKDKEELFQLQNKKANMEGRAPDESLEEITAVLKDAEEEFNNVLRTGENIRRIKEYTDKILKEVDNDTYSGIRKDLEYYVSRITDKRYKEINMEGWIPKGVLRDDEKVLPVDFLSVGTRDMLLFSLRLSMANYFLKGEDGFLLMDDPLVNLDPVRQLRVVELLKEFSEDKQVIIFTCNPYHAETLKGNIIDIGFCS